MNEKLSVRHKWYKIVVAELGKSSNIISLYAPKIEGLLSEPKLGRNSSLQEWKWVYLEQEAALLSGKYNKAHGKQEQSKKHWKKAENLIFKQKYIKN